MASARSVRVQREQPIRRVLYPITEFMHAEASGGIVPDHLRGARARLGELAWAAGYASLWETRLTIGVPGFAVSETLLHWINDGLMAVFFFIVGLEIKREVLVGELAAPRQAALPIAAALGGMLIPAAIYAAVNAGGTGAGGWGIPMATDIAFALGVLALLGRRAPTGLKIFLTALAIVDDLGAVLVIALFYTSQISWVALAAAAGFLAALIAANLLNARHPAVYALLGLGLWVAFLQSGVHATIAGVLLALTIPARVIAGLLVGKQVGVTLGAWLAVRLGLADLPEGVGWWHLYGAGWLAGIGFTMSLFVGSLAFGAGALLDTAKLGILAASLLAGLVGWALLRFAAPIAEPRADLASQPGES